MTTRLVALLGSGLIDPGAAAISAHDLGLTRGDGCFEATRVVTDASGEHRIDHLREHLDRFDQSCAGLDLPRIDRAAWTALIDQLLGGWQRPGEAMLRLMLSRGREWAPTEGITGVGTLTPITEHSLAQRADGLAVIALGRGTAANAYAEAPWLLGGVKTLSYGVNTAGLREAARRGADDVIFTSTDGYLLEAPTATVVWLSDNTLCTTPPGATGVLASITQQALFAAAEQAGFRTRYQLGRVADLHAAEGSWLVSSGRGVARLNSIDGRRLPGNRGVSDKIAALAGF